MKTIIFAGAFFVIIIGAGIVYITTQNEQPQLMQKNTTVQNSSSSAQNDTDTTPKKESDQIMYTNSEYGFTLTFPQSWEDYIATNRILDWGDFGFSDSIDFGFQEQDSLFNVSIHTKNQWKDIESQEGPMPIYIGETEQYIFGYSRAQDADEPMMMRMEEVSSIVETFRVSQ